MEVPVLDPAGTGREDRLAALREHVLAHVVTTRAEPVAIGVLRGNREDVALALHGPAASAAAHADAATAGKGGRCQGAERHDDGDGEEETATRQERRQYNEA
jgi:hypothetical protein